MRRLGPLLLLAALACLVSMMAFAQQPERWPLRLSNLSAPPVSMRQTVDGPVLGLVDGSHWLVEWQGDAAVLTPAVAPPQQTAPDLIPHGRVAVSQDDRTIRRAWLAVPTTDYAHGILGDEMKAAELRVETADGKTLIAKAPAGSVFEDLELRLWDIDFDGRVEVWVMRSDHDQGARLEAYAVEGQALKLLYTTPPIGYGFRWLNPIGVADFTGDGWREVALVRTPHIGGILTLFRPSNGQVLEATIQVPGVSNHAIGSRELGLSWVGDINKDGYADILLPSRDRYGLIAWRFPRGKIGVIGASERGGHIETSFGLLRTADGGKVIVFGDDTPALRWLRLPD